MKLNTTFWSEKVHEFTEVLYINSRTNEVIFKASLLNKYQASSFFKQASKFVKSAKVLKSKNNISQNYNDIDCYQFAVMLDGKMNPIKWFDLVISDKLTISHDIAFSTTLIKRNGIEVPFGRFPMYYYSKNINLPKYREFNIKARAYKFFANEVKKS